MNFLMARSSLRLLRARLSRAQLPDSYPNHLYRCFRSVRSDAVLRQSPRVLLPYHEPPTNRGIAENARQGYLVYGNRGLVYAG